MIRAAPDPRDSSSKSSSRFALFEAVVLVAPLLLCLPFAFFVLLVENLRNPARLLVGLFHLSASAFALVALLRVLLDYVFDPVEATRRAPAWCWRGIDVGVVLVVLALFLTALEQVGIATEPPWPILELGLLGLPALLPTLHMWTDYHRGARRA